MYEDRNVQSTLWPGLTSVSDYAIQWEDQTEVGSSTYLYIY